MRIQIIGYSGSGKSTLAKKLSEIYQIPVLHLDNVHFYGNWEERSKEEQNQIVDDFLEKNNSWVIDGNYSAISPQRFEIADMIIFLNFNRFICYKSAKNRYKKYKGTARESCPCEEKFDFAFKKWILWEGRTRERKKKHLKNLSHCHGQKYIFKNRKQVNQFLEQLRRIGHNL